MGFQIEDGTGKGYRSGVTDENQLKVVAESHELQHHISRLHGQVYQVIGTHTVAGAGTLNILNIKNTSSTRDAIVSYMRVQYPGGDGTVDASTYISLGFGLTRSASGTLVTPANMNNSSANTAELECYNDNPTVTGTFEEFDRWYPDKDMQIFNKHGSLILGQNDALTFRLITDQVTGLVYARATIMMISKDDA